MSLLSSHANATVERVFEVTGSIGSLLAAGVALSLLWGAVVYAVIRCVDTQPKAGRGSAAPSVAPSVGSHRRFRARPFQPGRGGRQ
jgi:hypothetical protein